MPASIPLFPNAHFFEQCDQTTSVTWVFWIPGAQTVIPSAGIQLTPLEWYDKELSARGFQVRWITSQGTPFYLQFSGRGLAGTIGDVSVDPPAEAPGERFVDSLAITVNR